jgi:glycosyltransferase involved in cell wall biosynthesis
LITVITPTIPERGALLAEAIESVAAQTLKPDAHLISVDVHKLGPARLLNEMTAAAKTPWVSILADDDLYDPDHLESLAAEADGADVVFSWSRITDGRQQYRGEFRHEDFLNRGTDTGMRGCFMFTKTAWEKCGGWVDEPCEDWGFISRLITSGAYFRAVYRETWTYRV